jgi:hypothetical protein
LAEKEITIPVMVLGVNHMAALVGLIFHVEARLDADLDAQEENLANIRGVQDIEFHGVPGGGSYFAVQWMPTKGITQQGAMKAMDRAISKAKKCSNDNSEVLDRASRRAFANLGGYMQPGQFGGLAPRVR